MSAVDQEDDNLDVCIQTWSKELAKVIVLSQAPQAEDKLDTAKKNIDKGLEGAKKAIDILNWLSGIIGAKEDKSSNSTDNNTDNDNSKKNWEDLQSALGKFSKFLGAVSIWGSAISFAIGLFVKEKEKKDMVVEKLGEVIQKLDNICSAIKLGFDKEIAHADAKDFRKNVEIPVNILWNSMLECSSTATTERKKHFLDNCKLYDPSDLLTKIETYVTSKLAGVITSQLEAGKYRYPVVELWNREILHYCSLLPIIRVHYLGLVKKVRKETFYADDASFLLQKIGSISWALEGITRRRQVQYFEVEGGKYAKEDLKEIVECAAKQVEKPTENLEKVQAIADKMWREANGPAPFCLFLFFGSTKENCHTVYRIGDKKKCVVAENIFDAKRDDSQGTYTECYRDMCAAVIQPLTQEMISKHFKRWRDTEAKGFNEKDSTRILNGLDRGPSADKPPKPKRKHEKAIDGYDNVVLIIGNAYTHAIKKEEYDAQRAGKWIFVPGQKFPRKVTTFSPLSGMVPAMCTLQYAWFWAYDGGIFNNYAGHNRSYILTTVIYA